jgi:hypothetical protein
LIMSAAAAFFVYGYENFGSSIRYVRQQERVSDTISRIRKDVEKASDVTFTTSGAVTFKFQDGSEQETYKFIEDTDASKDDCLSMQVGIGNFVPVLTNIKTPESKFTKGSDDRLILTIKLVATNTGKHAEYNIKKSIITEYSLKYKNVN